MKKTFLQIVVCCLFLTIAAGCTAEETAVPRSSEVVAVDSTNTPTTVPTSAAAPTSIEEPTSTAVPISTEEPPPTVDATPVPETEGADNEDAETERVVAIDITMPLPVGDPQSGAALVEVKACSGCHYLGRVGSAPSWKAEIYAKGKGIATRAEERWQLEGYAGEATSPTEYLVESILMPNAYVIEGYMQGTMPQTFSDLLTEQELADIISYLLEIE